MKNGTCAVFTCGTFETVGSTQLTRSIKPVFVVLEVSRFCRVCKF